MAQPVVYIDQSAIREGKLEQLKLSIRKLVDFVDSHEDRIIAYGVYLDEHETQMTVWQVHPDSASLEYHMEVAGPAFQPFVDLLELSRIDIYGEPSEKLVGQLRRKAAMLGNGTVSVHALEAGFARLGQRVPARP